MTVSGDLATIDLADLFQNIEGHGRSGTLTITCDGQVSRIFFRAGKVAALSCEGRGALPERLCAQGVITERNLAAVQRKRRGGKTMVEALIKARAIDADAARAAAESALSEDVSDLVASARGEFEFGAGDVPGEGFDPEELDLDLALPASPLILEATRRVDHWVLIREVIPSDSINFVALDGSAAPGEGDDAELGQLLLDSLDGTRSVRELAAAFPGRRFAVFRILSELVRARLVRAANADDLVSVAEDLAATDPERARALVEHGLETEPHHQGLLAVEVELAEEAGDTAAATRYLKTRAHLRLEAGDKAAALADLEHAKRLTPRDPLLWERTLQMAIAEGRRKDALGQGQRLVELYREPGLHDKARDVLERMVALEPDALDLRVDLARAQADSGAPEEAVAGLVRLGRKLLGRANDTAARIVFAQVLAIEPSHNEAARSIKMLDQQEFARRRERRARNWHRVRLAVACALLSVPVVREVLARGALAALDAQMIQDRLQEHADYRGVAQRLEQLAAAHPFTLVALYDIPYRMVAVTQTEIELEPPASRPAGSETPQNLHARILQIWREESRPAGKR